MRDYLLFQLYGPMSSWGRIAVGESRHSDSYPSKSAVMGIIGAALGIRRTEDDKHRELFTSYAFGVKVISPGTMLQDYHTTQAPPAQSKVQYFSRYEELRNAKQGTVLSQREYRCEALSIAALWTAGDDPPYSLETLAEALKYPKFTLYLGRKSCPPALPLQPLLMENMESLKAVLDSYEKTEDMAVPKNISAHYCWEKSDEPGMDIHQQIHRHDDCISRIRWQFAERKENLFLQGKGE